VPIQNALPLEEYRSRLERWQTEHAASDRRSRQLGNARLATGIAAVVIAALVIGAGVLSPWWLLLPLAAFVVLAILHDRVDKRRDAALRGSAYYNRALARMENRWIGRGHQGEAFRDPKHLYADDLDLLGPGSAFELLSTSRTATGDRMLAEWLLAPAAPEVVKARQVAVAELRGRLDLREDIALMGEDIRTAIDDQAMKAWGVLPAVRFFPGARWVAFALGCAAVLTFALFLAQVLTLRPLLALILAELIFGLVVRDGVRSVAVLVSTPARELKLVRLLLERLEKEQFTAPRLEQLAHALDMHGLTPSAEIRRLEHSVEYLDSARNQFFRVLAAPLVWIPQFTMAIEAWRQECGPHIGEWIAAVGEFEALCSLAAFAYERPDAVFPELAVESGPLFEGYDVRHPLIPRDHAVGNDVKLGVNPNEACALWIVSGSNMSGKSTLLRAVGLNSALAWAGAPVCCARLRVSPLRIGASIRLNDSLADNKSRFYAEISRLRDIVDLARAGQPTLFLLDELLSGTNSHDRRIGAAAVIKGLVERGAIGLVTTHDLALADITGTLGERARNVHFEDYIENGEIHFDYHLRPGVVERSNALELMRAVGLDV
jgi:ABC-type multidrug transport system fused ATPase/permease subunit